MRFNFKWRNARLLAAVGAVLPWVGASAAQADPVKVSHRVSVLGPIRGNNGNANGIATGNANTNAGGTTNTTGNTNTGTTNTGTTDTGNTNTGTTTTGTTGGDTTSTDPGSQTPVTTGSNTTDASASGGGSHQASDNDPPVPMPNFIIDLTSHGATGVGNGAIYTQEDFQPTGTGVFQPFLRIQESGPDQDGIEIGYNTDGRPVDGDTKDNNLWTHSLESQTPEIVVRNGLEYLAFRLDVNEQGSSDDRIIWLNKLEIYLGDRPDLMLDSPGGLGDLVYSLDNDPRGNGSVKIDYRLEHGSGSGDMEVLISRALFQPDRYIYLLSEFSGADAGFEEWSARVNPNPPPPPPPPPGVPLPGVVWTGLALLSSTGIVRMVRRKKVVE